MTGTLGLFSLVDLFQLLSASKRTGRLVVDHPTALARVYFDKGTVVHAEFGQWHGEEAVYALFADEQGTFEFSIGLPAPELSVRTSTENLVLEAIRRLDEGRRDDADLEAAPTDDMIPYFASDAKEAGDLTLKLHEIQVLRYVDGQRNIAELAAASQTDIEQVRRVVARLARIGALELGSQRPRVARLVARLGDASFAGDKVGIDAMIVDSWQRVLGHAPQYVACKRPDGRVDLYGVEPVPEVGPYILFSRDNLLATDLAVDTALLVKPWSKAPPQ